MKEIKLDWSAFDRVYIVRRHFYSSCDADCTVSSWSEWSSCTLDTCRPASSGTKVMVHPSIKLPSMKNPFMHFTSLNPPNVENGLAHDDIRRIFLDEMFLEFKMLEYSS